MKTAILALIGICIAAPAAAQAQTVYVVKYGESDRITVTPKPTLDRKIQTAAEAVCERPYIRDLKGWVMYNSCLTEVRSEIEEQLAEKHIDAVEVALR